MVDSNDEEKSPPDATQHNNVVENVWRASVDPKIKEAVQDEPVRMRLQALTWTLMVIFLLVAIIYVAVEDRCTTTTGLVEAGNVNTDGYKCEYIVAPQEFDGQTYYETALWWGFAVTSAWGTFGGSNWDEYCLGLMGNISNVVRGEDWDAASTSDRFPWEYSFENTAGGTDLCNFESRLVYGANVLPNAPGGLLRCTGPDGFIDCVDSEGVAINGSDMRAVWSKSDSFGLQDAFCPDFLVWDPSYVRHSPLDQNQTNDELCSIWGQDVGIVSRSVQTCSKELCLTWWNILADAIALSVAVQSVILVGTVCLFKVNESRKAKNEQNKRDGEEKDGDEEKQSGEDEDTDLRTLARETVSEVLEFGRGFTRYG